VRVTDYAAGRQRRAHTPRPPARYERFEAPANPALGAARDAGLDARLGRFCYSTRSLVPAAPDGGAAAAPAAPGGDCAAPVFFYRDDTRAAGPRR